MKRSAYAFFFWLLFSGILLPNLAAITIKVAPGGNDAADGLSQPLRSVAVALNKARMARQQQPNQTIFIELADGRYELSEVLRLGPEDSGVSAEHRLIIAAAPGARPVLTGGRKITGWTRDQQNPQLWHAAIPEVKEGKWYFRQLFVDGVRQQRARTPNQGFYRIQGESPQDKPVRLRFAENEIRKEWAGSGDVEVVALLAWADLRMQIREVDQATRIAILSGDPRPSNKEANARYYIENTADALDSPGEWYLDRQTGKLSFWAESEKDLTKTEVIAPFLPDLLHIIGTPTHPVRYVTLQGLTFQHTDWELPSNGYADTQAAIGINGDVRFEYVTDSRVIECNFSHLGGYALELGRGVQNVQVVGNEMTDLAAGGIRIGETTPPTTSADQNHSHLISDNHLHQAGLVYPAAVGVLLLQSGTNRIAHNHIHHLFYTAVSLGWTWGYRESPCRQNIVEWNHLHHIGQGMLSDMGAVYTLGVQRGTVIRHNLIHDVSASNYGGWGLYTDEGSTGILLENNIVYNCKHAGFHQHYGRENVIRNNLFAFNQEFQLMRTRAEPHISFFFTNNIVYFDSGRLLGSNWSNDNYRMDHNLYYDSRDPDGKNMLFAGLPFDQWQQRGHDRHSLIQDPLFLDPATRNFALKSNSPAFKLGFQPLPQKGFGVRPRAERAKLYSP
jgi:parallel beta-helix repeat protein